jgi:ribosomal protein S18 acetylase RimI-like enzyme
MLSLNIRPASINDIPSIVDIRVRTLSEEDIAGFVVPDDNLYSSSEKLRKIWEGENKLKDGFEVFVAECGKKVFGFIVFKENCNDNIDNLIVAKEEQRKGVGRALVEYVETMAKARGLDVIKTDTTENARGIPWKAYGFWKKMGYVDTGERILTEYDFKVIPLVKKLK